MSSMKHIVSVTEHYMQSLVGSVVEIGSERGGGSTEILSRLCLRCGLKFYSVDFERGAYERAVGTPFVRAYKMTGEEFLAHVFPAFGERICLAYLDNFDFIFPYIEEKKFVHKQMELYRSYGFEMNNDNSKRAHLRQAISIEKFASDKCIVVLDDTWYINGEFDGKGGLAAPYLIAEGFNILHATPRSEPHHKRYVVLKRGLT